MSWRIFSPKTATSRLCFRLRTTLRRLTTVSEIRWSGSFPTRRRILWNPYDSLWSRAERPIRTPLTRVRNSASCSKERLPYISERKNTRQKKENPSITLRIKDITFHLRRARRSSGSVRLRVFRERKRYGGIINRIETCFQII